MLSDPATDDELNQWAANADVPIDRRLFNAVQPHFTAAPILQDIEDPIRRRYALVEGAFDVVAFDCARGVHRSVRQADYLSRGFRAATISATSSASARAILAERQKQ